MPSITLPTENVDFEGLKSDLKSFLSGKSGFTDHNFDGSALNLIVELLSYNTHILSYYASMGFNEAFLDSARLRKNVVSIAKHLSYKASSWKSAKATLTLTFSGLSATVTVPAGSKFRTTIDGVVYTFVTLDSYDFTPSAPSRNIDVHEGTLLSETFAYSDSLDLVLGNERIDDTTISVSVAGDVWPKAGNIVVIDGTSEVFFLSDDHTGYQRIDFGDGIIGAKPADSATIIVTYLKTNGPDANGAKTFTAATSFSGFTPTIALVDAASGGAEPESLDNIRRNAPRFYASQNRCVTEEDYEAKIRENFSDIETINVWGGDQNEPKALGKVYISIKPLSGNTLTESKKADIVTYLNAFKVMNITPVIIDPVFISVDLTLKIRYNPAKLGMTETALKSLITTAVLSYGDTNLEKFQTYFKASDFLAYVDDVHPSIRSSLLDIRLSQTVTMDTSAAKNYTIDFGNPTVEDSVLPATFETYQNHATGLMTITQYRASTSNNTITVQPVELDVFPKKNQIVRFGNVSVTMVAVS